MEDELLDPVAAQRAIPDTYSGTIKAFFTDLTEQETADYTTNIKRVLSLEYVLLRADVDEQGRAESDRRELTYTIESVDLNGLTVNNIGGRDERDLSHEEVREEFEFTPMEATLETFGNET